MLTSYLSKPLIYQRFIVINRLWSELLELCTEICTEFRGYGDASTFDLGSITIVIQLSIPKLYKKLTQYPLIFTM
jgi:hypothetical protein